MMLSTVRQKDKRDFEIFYVLIQSDYERKKNENR